MADDICRQHSRPWELCDDWDGDDSGVWYSPVFRCDQGCERLARSDGAGGYYVEDDEEDEQPG